MPIILKLFHTFSEIGNFYDTKNNINEIKERILSILKFTNSFGYNPPNIKTDFFEMEIINNPHYDDIYIIKKLENRLYQINSKNN